MVLPVGATNDGAADVVEGQAIGEQVPCRCEDDEILGIGAIVDAVRDNNENENLPIDGQCIFFGG